MKKNAERAMVFSFQTSRQLQGLLVALYKVAATPQDLINVDLIGIDK
jgi:hypothetical protein